MLGRSKRFIAKLMTATLLFSALSLHADGQSSGKYTPCLVVPVFVRPAISKGIITQPEIVTPEFDQTLRTRWLIERTDIEPPNIVQAVIVAPKYDGCDQMNTGNRLYLQRVYGSFGLTSSTPKTGINSSVAARVFTDASSTSCCGGSAGGR